MIVLALLPVFVIVANISPSFALASSNAYRVVVLGFGRPSSPSVRRHLAGRRPSIVAFGTTAATTRSSHRAATAAPRACHAASSSFSSSSSSSRLLARPGPRGHPSAFRSALRAAASATSTSSSTSAADDAKRTAFATFALIVLDVIFRSIFVRFSIPFPSSLAGCGALFVFMIMLNSFDGAMIGGDGRDGRVASAAGERLYRTLNPGAMLLAKWLPVFFVPSLITLPLASGLGNAWEVGNLRF